jgi:E3 ubiquitin-protein ligase DOA10
MDFSQFLPLLVTFLVTLVGSYITIKVTITELKKDLVFLKDKLESELASKLQHEAQAKDDMKEVKEDLKMIFKSINEVQINFARMEARSEGKDEVISELKNAVTTILQQRG